LFGFGFGFVGCHRQLIISLYIFLSLCQGFYSKVLSPFAQFTREDFVAHVGTSEWVQPLSARYGDGASHVVVVLPSCFCSSLPNAPFTAATLYELPPNTQVFIAKTSSSPRSHELCVDMIRGLQRWKCCG
jgi:hypothetical protein